MGQAKLRGTYEERKDRAIASGKVKTKRITKREINEYSYDFLQDLLLSGYGLYRCVKNTHSGTSET